MNPLKLLTFAMFLTAILRNKAGEVFPKSFGTSFLECPKANAPYLQQMILHVTPSWISCHKYISETLPSKSEQVRGVEVILVLILAGHVDEDISAYDLVMLGTAINWTAHKLILCAVTRWVVYWV